MYLTIFSQKFFYIQVYLISYTIKVILLVLNYYNERL